MHEKLFLALATLLACSPALATQPSDLDGSPVPQACSTELVALARMLKAQDHGLTKTQALEIDAKAGDKDKISTATIDDAYRYPNMSHDGLIGYSLWACVANSYGVVPLPLSEVEVELDACVRRKGDHVCGLQIRNRVWGLPATYVSKQKSEVRVVAQPPSAAIGK